MSDLPPHLERYQDRLERAITRDIARSSRRRRLLTGVGVVGAAAVAVFAGIALFGGSGGGGPAHIASASALDKAAAALEKPTGVILHVHTIGTQDNGDGTTVTWRDESWQLTSAPYDRRQVEKAPGTPRSETGVVDGRNALYDAARDTIYTGGEPWSDDGGGTDESFRQQALAALKSPTTTVAGHVTVDGRDAIKIVVSARGDEVYLVDATTYDPIEWQTRGTDGGVTLRFAAYERLPLSADNEALLSLEKQHPGASVDGDPAHYSAALDRLFPNG